MATDLTLLSRVSFRGREVTSPRIGGLLALLADDLRTGCSTALLVEGLWPDKMPENPTKVVQILVSRARALLGARAWADVARRVHRSNTARSSADSSNGSSFGPRRGTDGPAAEVTPQLTINYWRRTLVP